MLEAYKYLSDPKNPREEGSTTSEQQQQQQSTTDSQATHRRESRDQRMRRETYDYFNRVRKENMEQAEGPGGYDSFLETIKAAPELVIMTLFIGFVVAQWFWMVPKQKQPYYVE